MKLKLLLPLFLLFPFPLFAQTPGPSFEEPPLRCPRVGCLIPIPLPPIPPTRPPVLFIPSPDFEPIHAESLEVNTKIYGALAETSMTFSFYNPNSRPLESELILPLPKGATVTGYALDVNGQLVDGVSVKKDRARQIFETEVRKNIDPGLLEWSRGNVFKTRVYPVPSEGRRQVRVSFTSQLNLSEGDAYYALPLLFTEPLKSAKIRIEVLGDGESPLIDSGLQDLKFNPRQVAEVELKEKPLKDTLVVKIPKLSEHPVQVQSDQNGDSWFSLIVQEQAPQVLDRIKVKHLQLVFDASGSRTTADIKKELSLLEPYLESLQDAKVSFQVLRDRLSTPSVFQLPKDKERLLHSIRTTPFDGATRIQALKSLPNADMLLFMSDGFSTYGEARKADIRIPTTVISSSQTADDALLAHLASSHGGLYLDLHQLSAKEALPQLGRVAWSLLGVEVLEGKILDLTPSGSANAFPTTDVSGRLLSSHAKIRLSWGLLGKPPSATKEFHIEKGQIQGELTRLFAANQQLNALLGDPNKNRDAILALGQKHGLVTPETSLLVLETLAQYLEHDVRPPDMLKDMQRAWDEAIAKREKKKESDLNEHLEEAKALWQKEVSWYLKSWKPVFPQVKKKSLNDDEEEGTEVFMGSGSGSLRGAVGRGGGGRGGMARAHSVGSPQAREGAPFASAPEAMEEASDELADSGNSKKLAADRSPEAQITVQAWEPNSAYTKKLKAAHDGAKRKALYYELRKEYETSPSFFLDSSDVFFTQDEREMGFQVLSNLAEMKLDDPALLRVLGHRLAQYEAWDLAVEVFEYVKVLRPEEPQSPRDLGLAYFERAKTQKSKDAQKKDLALALQNLGEVIEGKWDRFEEIQVIALYELNHAYFWGEQQGLKAKFPLSKDFMKDMPLDVRIAMSWDTDLTDIDLHVIEPTGEHVFYSHQESYSGGRLSKDFTEGYGPETYSLKKGFKGAFKVKTRFYGSRSQKVIGAVSLKVELYQNWGRPNEKKKSIVLRLDKPGDEFNVGELSF